MKRSEPQLCVTGHPIPTEVQAHRQARCARIHGSTGSSHTAQQSPARSAGPRRNPPSADFRVDARSASAAPVRLVERRAQRSHRIAETRISQRTIETVVERVGRSLRQLGRCDPETRLLLRILAPKHSHPPSLMAVATGPNNLPIRSRACHPQARVFQQADRFRLAERGY